MGQITLEDKVHTRYITIVLLLFFSWSNGANAGDKRVISLGTGGITGVYYPTGGGICRVLNKEREKHGIRCALEATFGSVSNIERVLKGELDVGIAQSNNLDKQGGGNRQETSKLRTLLVLYPEYFTVIVRKNSSIKRFQDIKGKKISIGKEGSSLRATMTDLMLRKGWQSDDFSRTLSLDSAAQASALCEGVIDVMIYTVGHPSAAAREATEDCESRLIPVEGKAIEQLLMDNAYYHWATIPGAIYKGNIKSTPTFGVSAALFTSKDMSDDTAYAIVKALLENLDEFRRLHPAFSRLDPEAMVAGPFAAPLHSGAEKYFKEIGLISE